MFGVNFCNFPIQTNSQKLTLNHTIPSLRESFTLSSRGCRPSNPEQVELASQDHSEITHSSPEGNSFRPLLRFSLSYLTPSRFDVFPANHAELGTAPIEISSDGIEGEASHWLRMGCQLLMNGLRNISSGTNSFNLDRCSYTPAGLPSQPTAP